MSALLDEALAQILTTDPGVTRFSGARCYLERAPKDAVAPYLVRDEISHTPNHTLDRISGLETRRIQVTCWARTATDALWLREAVKAALNFYGGTVTVEASPARSVEIQSCQSDTEATAWDDEAGANPRLFGRTVDFIVMYRT